MAGVEDLNRIPPTNAEGLAPGVHLDGDSGYIVTPPGDEPNHEDIARVLKASRLNPDDFIVEPGGTQRITTHLDANGNLVQAWYKLRFHRKPERQFDVQQLVEHIHTPIKKPRKPKHQDALTIMLSDQHIGKAEHAGGGTPKIIDRWRTSVTRALADGTYKHINLVLGGDTIEGYISQGGRNITDTDMYLAEQLTTAQELVGWTVRECAEHATHVHVSAVPGNHAETTRVQNVPIGDSYDVMIARNVETAINLIGLGDRVTFHYPTMGDGSVTYTVDGTTFTIAHGHKFKGQMKGAENWWAGHIANGRHPADSHILLAGHFHNFQAANWTRNRWIMFAPSLETESTWFANSTGTTSLPGALVFNTHKGQPHNIHIV